MDYDILFDEHPELYGQRVLLRQLTAEDVPALFQILKDDQIIKYYSTVGEFKSLQQVHHNFITGSQTRFYEQDLIAWAIEDIETGELMGVRECYIDGPDLPVTIQGFIGKEYRKMGFSAEAYKLIIRFLESADVEIIHCNVDIENFSAMAMLSSVGFRQASIYNEGGVIRIKFKNDLTHSGINFNGTNIKVTGGLKNIFVFCLMYLNAIEIQIISISAGYSIDGKISNQTIYKLEVMSQDLSDNRHDIIPRYGIIRNPIKKLIFLSDGISISDLNMSRFTYIDGTTSYQTAWEFCWSNCAIF